VRFAFFRTGFLPSSFSHFRAPPRSALRTTKPAGTTEQRIAQVKADLKSEDPLVRRSAIGSLIHSDISSMMLDEMRAALGDRDGEVIGRSPS
jgi:hypothetical protein